MEGLKYPNYDTKNESQLLDFWQNTKIIEKINERNKSGEKFYFLQGPPYTSGKIHCGHAWNHSLKDAILRYKRMKGYDVLARAGYDMHGLPTELKVQAKLGLSGKDDIEKFGFEKFAEECILWSEEKANDMNQDLKNLGVTLDFTEPYKPITQDYIDSVWYLLKQADKKNRLYLGEKTMLWCPKTESALAKHEVEYKTIKDTSVFLKFKKENTPNEYYIIWTTTPWTIPLNLAIMVNPDMEYVDCEVTLKPKHEKEGKEDSKTTENTTEVWTLCKDLAGMFLGNLDNVEYTIGKPYLGSKLEGKKYSHPWENINPDIQEIKKESKNLFSILLSTEYVDSSAGTGLVHCAPGCGPEDYEVGLKYGLPPYNIIDEKGMFPKTIEKFANLTAKTDDIEFVKLMIQDGFLVKKSPIEHDYPFSERGKVPAVFRKTKQWFFKVEDLKPKMLEINNQTNWHPLTAKNAFTSWLDNLRDNSITKQRLWGTPAPIWVARNEEGEVTEHYVVESSEELKTLATTPLPKNLHKPWIDDIEIKHPKTNTILKRIPDVLDVWIDAGCASWASLYYPKRTDLFEKYFPADFICEGKDQIRGWYNLLMVAGILGHDKQVFKNVSMHGFIADVDGVKMSKSLGNVISPTEVIEKSSVDNFRYYFSKTKAGEDIAFSWEQLTLHQRHLSVLWNTTKYFLDMLAHEIQSDVSAKVTVTDLFEIGKKHIADEEKCILSKTNRTLKEVTTLFESYKLDEVPSLIGDLFLSISRDYIQAVRDKTNGSNEEKAAVLYALHESLQKTITMFAPICPFITEMMYQNMKTLMPDIYKDESVHQLSWSTPNEDVIDENLEASFDSALSIISGILASREKAKINVRQPLAKAIIISKKKEMLKAGDQFADMISTQTNVKQIDVVEEFNKLEYSVKANFKNLGADFGQLTAAIGTTINQLSKDVAHIIHETFAEGKSYVLEYENQNKESETAELKPHHIDFTVSVSEPYLHAEVPKAIIAIDTTLSEELLNEGLAREITRRIQQQRKDLGLVKKDKVKVELDSLDVFEKIKPFIEDVSAVCGVSEFDAVANGSLSSDAKEFTIKDVTFKLGIQKI